MVKLTSRTLSLLLCCYYAAYAYFNDGGKGDYLLVWAFLVLPMVCIWFPEPVGDYTGILARRPITETSPGCAVAFMGWALLLLPVLVVIVKGIAQL